MRRARREYAESKALLPDDATLNLVTWQDLFKLLLHPQWSGARWARDLRAYLRICGLASFHGIRRDMADGDHLRAVCGWRSGSHRSEGPAFSTSVATLAAEPAIADLRHWGFSNVSRRRRRS
jgi:hypothetical protein